MRNTTVAVFTADDFLFTKILLSAPDEATVLRGNENVSAELLLVDLDTCQEKIASHQNTVTMSRTSDKCDIKIPFSLNTLACILKEDTERPALTLDCERRIAYLHGEPIKLTEVERALLALLIRNGGEYVSREEILKSVWAGEADAGVINVYVHYLREKLESHGEKIIISSRKCGYKVDEKYLSGEVRHA